MKNKLIYIAAITLTLFSISGCNRLNKKNIHNGSKNITIEAMTVNDTLIDFSSVISGTFLANEATELRSETQGRVIAIYFSEGTTVKKGNLLVKVDDSELQANLKRVNIDLVQVKNEYERRKGLLIVKGISLEEFEQSRTKLESLEAQSTLLKVQISKTEIRAPFTGQIGLREISQGAYITPNTLITTLQQIDPIKLEFNIPEQYRNSVSDKASIVFTTEGSQKEWKANVYASDSRIDEATRTIKVRAICPNPDHHLLPGGFAKIKIDLDPGRKNILIPASALVPVLNGQIVYLIKKGRSIATPVKTGIRTEREVEITEGIKPNDTIALTGLLQLKDSLEVTVNLKH